MITEDDLNIRLATIDDIPQIVHISEGAWDKDYIPNVAGRWLDDPSGRFVVAECSKVIRGFGRLTFHTPERAWLEGLRVDSSFRRHGVGRAIGRRLMDEALDAGVKSMRFATYYDNIESITMNEAVGFVLIAGGRWLCAREGAMPELAAAAAERYRDCARGSVVRIGNVDDDGAFAQAILDSSTVAGSGNMIPAGFVYYPASVEFIRKLAGSGCAYAVYSSHGATAPGAPGAVLLASIWSESYENTPEIVINVLEGEPDLCRAALAVAFDEFNRRGVGSVVATVPCGSTAEELLLEVGLVSEASDVSAGKPTVLLYDYRGPGMVAAG